MRRLVILALPALALALASLVASSFQANAQGTPEEAKALAERAAAHMREVGPKQAIEDFNDPKGKFVDRNLFVVTYGPDRKVLSSVFVRAYLGRDATRFVDADGKEFGKAIIATAQSADSAGWVTYRMSSPLTHKVEIKTSYVVKAGDYVVLVGAYKP